MDYTLYTNACVFYELWAYFHNYRDLKDNEMTSIPDNLFKGLTSLKYL